MKENFVIDSPTHSAQGFTDVLAQTHPRHVKEYVLGFCFELEGGTMDEPQVVLIRKLRPNWQKGKLNGIGGQIEPGENALDAMRREWREETGEVRERWELFLVFADAHTDVVVHCFRNFTLQSSKAKTVTDEPVVRVSVDRLPEYAVPNLHWLIPMALCIPAKPMLAPRITVHSDLQFV